MTAIVKGLKSGRRTQTWGKYRDFSPITPTPEAFLPFFMDVRRVQKDLLQDVDAIVHLASISNGPMGNSFEEV